MAPSRVSRLLSWAVAFVALAPLCASLTHHLPREKSEAFTQDVFSADAEKNIKADETEEGEAHGEIKVPEGSTLTSIKVNKHGKEEIAAFINEDMNKTSVEHIFIVIHGRLRDGNHYWRSLNSSVEDARKHNVSGSDVELAIIAPQFFSTIYNTGQYSENQLAWGDLNAWQPGGTATHPDNTTLSSFDVIDGIIMEYLDTSDFASLKNVTVLGHGGGGQLTQRYATVGSARPDGLHIRYIHGDPSSCVYFTDDRPTIDDQKYFNSDCPSYNTWRYGFDDYPGNGGELQTPKEYFNEYAKRDVVSIVGYEDYNTSGDVSCMAQIQGGIARRNRNLIWYRYVNMLAGTNETLDGLPGHFEDLPEWGPMVNYTVGLNLVVIRDAAHDFEELFEGTKAQEVLFNQTILTTGWPDTDDIAEHAH